MLNVLLDLLFNLFGLKKVCLKISYSIHFSMHCYLLNGIHYPGLINVPYKTNKLIIRYIFWIFHKYNQSLINLFRCHCGKCINMPTAVERSCCKKNPIVNGKIEAANLTCITEYGKPWLSDTVVQHYMNSFSHYIKPNLFYMIPVEPYMEPDILISHHFNNVLNQKAIYDSSLY